MPSNRSLLDRNIPKPYCETHRPCKVEIVGNRLSDEALQSMGIKNIASNWNDNTPVKHKAALPKHQGKYKEQATR